MPSLVRKLLGLTTIEWRDLLRAQHALLTAQWRVRTQPVGSLAGRDALAESRPEGDPARALALSRAVQRAARYGVFRPYCLVQSLALRTLLESDGVRGSAIRVGVRRENGAFQAHSWVRWGDRVLGDEATHVATFTEVTDLRVIERP